MFFTRDRRVAAAFACEALESRRLMSATAIGPSIHEACRSTTSRVTHGGGQRAGDERHDRLSVDRRANGAGLARRHAPKPIGSGRTLLDFRTGDVEHESQHRSIDADLAVAGIEPPIARSEGGRRRRPRLADDASSHDVSLTFATQHRRQIDEQLEREALARRQMIVGREREHEEMEGERRERWRRAAV